MNWRSSSLLFLAMVPTLWNSACSAEIDRFRMTGTVTVDDPTFVLPGGVVTGAPFTAFLMYDTSVPDSLPDDPSTGYYELHKAHAEFGLSLLVGELGLRNDPEDDFILRILDNAPPLPGISPPTDAIESRAVSSIGGPNNPSSLLQPTLAIAWYNPQMDSWNSDMLPTILVPSMFIRADIFAAGADEQPPLGRPYFITASVTSVFLVPEPQSIAPFLVIALAGVNSRGFVRRYFCPFKWNFRFSRCWVYIH